MNTKTPVAASLGRFGPLAAVGSALLTIVAYLVIGPNPDSEASTTTITAYYSAHHAHAYLAGMLLMYAAVLFALFGAAVWARIRETALHPILAGTVLIATAVATASDLAGASGWYLLGDLGGKHTISPATIQGLHITVASADMPSVAALGTFLVAFAAAGIVGSAFPRWLAWSALVLGILQLNPIPTPGKIDFVAGLLILPWMIATGIVMYRRAGRPAPATAQNAPTAPLSDPA
jgi:hypothetical protein